MLRLPKNPFDNSMKELVSASGTNRHAATLKQAKVFESLKMDISLFAVEDCFQRHSDGVKGEVMRGGV